MRRVPSAAFVFIAVSRSLAKSRGWKVSPRHPLAGRAPEILEWDEGVRRIDWGQMDRKDRSYDEDRDCRLACMAEALSPVTVAASDFQSLWVASDEVEARVKELVKEAGASCYVNKKPHLFPQGAK